MATLTAVSPEEYLNTSYEPDMEYVNGQLVERHVGEFIHGRLQILIGILLGARERERRFRVVTEVRVKVSDAPRYRIPDLSVKALPYRSTPILLQPDLVIEILSPDDEPGELVVKIADYTNAGIPYIWIVNPYKQQTISVEIGAIHEVTSHVLETPLVGPVDFGELFKQLDEPSE
jgi:Uma2 family endonuclease